MENTERWAKSQWCHPCNVRLISYFSSLLKDKLHRFPGRKCRSLTVLWGENVKPGFNWILLILGRKPLYCVNQIQDKRSCFLLHQKNPHLLCNTEHEHWKNPGFKTFHVIQKSKASRLWAVLFKKGNKHGHFACIKKLCVLAHPGLWVPQHPGTGRGT